MKRLSTTLRTILIAAAALGFSACKSDTLLRSQNPDVIDPGGLASAQGVTALYNGALGDFTVSMDGSGDTGVGLVEAGAWFSDEGRFGGTPPEVKQMDLRDVRKEANAWQSMYLNVHRARESSEQAALALANISKTDVRAGEMYAISALTHIMLGENYCSGVPFGTTSPELQYGQPLATVPL